MLAAIRRISPIVWMGLAFWFANAGFVNFYPFVTGDEVIGNDPASEWVLHGRVVSSVFQELPGFERGYFLQPPGQFITGVVAYELMGFGAVPTRLAAITWGALAVVMAGYLAAAWFGSRLAGMAAAGLLGLHPAFTQSAAQARMDAQTIALVLAGCLVFHRRCRPGESRARDGHMAIAGVLVGLAGITHPLAILWAAGLGLAGWWQAPRSGAKAAVIFFGAMGAPLLVWLGFAAGLPVEFAHQFLRHGAGKLTHLNVMTEIAAEGRKLQLAYAGTPLLGLALVGGAVWWWMFAPVSAAARKEGNCLLLCVGIGVLVVMDKGSGPYELHPAVLLCVWTGGMLADGWRRMRIVTGRQRFLAMAAGALLAANLGVKFAVPRLVAVTVQREARDLAALDAAVAAIIPPGAVVCGIPEYFYAVKGAGAWVRMAVPADASRHDFVIARPEPGKPTPSGFVRIAELGRSMPKFWGRDFSSALDYRAEVFASAVRGRVKAP